MSLSLRVYVFMSNGICVQWSDLHWICLIRTFYTSNRYGNSALPLEMTKNTILYFVLFIQKKTLSIIICFYIFVIKFIKPLNEHNQNVFQSQNSSTKSTSLCLYGDVCVCALELCKEAQWMVHRINVRECLESQLQPNQTSVHNDTDTVYSANRFQPLCLLIDFRTV